MVKLSVNTNCKCVVLFDTVCLSALVPAPAPAGALATGSPDFISKFLTQFAIEMKKCNEHCSK